MHRPRAALDAVMCCSGKIHLLACSAQAQKGFDGWRGPIISCTHAGNLCPELYTLLTEAEPWQGNSSSRTTCKRPLGCPPQCSNTHGANHSPCIVHPACQQGFPQWREAALVAAPQAGPMLQQDLYSRAGSMPAARGEAWPAAVAPCNSQPAMPALSVYTLRCWHVHFCC